MEMKRSFRLKILSRHLDDAVTYNMSSSTFMTNIVTSNDKIFVEPDAGYAPVLNFINSATSSLDICIYLLYDVQIENALIKLNEKGVKIRIIIPWQHNSSSFILEENLNKLKSEGIKINFSPLHYYNTHCKFMILDYEKCMIMDFNFEPSYFTTARGFGFITENKVDVQELASVFSYDFNRNVDKLPPPLASSSLVWFPSSKVYYDTSKINGINKVYNIIDNSKKTLDMYSFVLNDKEIQNKIINAANRNVKVRIIFNNLIFHTLGTNVNLRNKMLQSGIQLKYYEGNLTSYDRNNPNDNNFFMHSKSIMCDVDDLNPLAYVSSLNFNFASIYANRELGAIIKNRDITKIMSETFNIDWNSKYANTFKLNELNDLLETPLLETPFNDSIIEDIIFEDEDVN